MTDLKTELEQLASAIVREANTPGDDAPTFTQKVEALSELTKLYIAFVKHPGEEDEDTDDFNFVRGVQPPASQEQPNGAARIQPRRRASAA